MAEQNAKITDEQLKEIQETQAKVNQLLVLQVMKLHVLK